MEIKTNKNLSNQNNKLKKNIKLAIIYLIGVFDYYLSLRRINGIGMRCFKKKDLACFSILARLTILSSFLISFCIYNILFSDYYSKLHLIVIVSLYVHFYIKDHNTGIIKHGLFNFLGFISFTILFFLLNLYIGCLRYLFKKSRYFLIIVFISPFPSLFLIFRIYRKHHFLCIDWDKGLNNTYIDNYSKDYPCKINIPKNNTCFISEIGHYFDFTALYRPTCNNTQLILSQIKQFRSSLRRFNISYYNISKKNFFGYPLTNNDFYNYNICGTLVIPGMKNLQNELHNNIILMDLFNKNKTKYYKNESEPEVLVKVSRNNGKLYIKINRNNTLIEERRKINAKLGKKKMFENVLVFFIDTVSRAHFFRKCPKTINFLNKFTKYETNYIKKNTTIFQFLKYNSLNTFTNPNLKAAYYGAKFDGNGTHFANYFKNNGYITGRASSLCEKLNIYSNVNISLNHIIWDHESISIPCIKGIYDHFFVTRIMSVVKRCFLGKELLQYSLDYLESFWTTYFKYNKLFVFDSGDAHEPTLQLIGYLDEIFYNFFYKFFSNNWFKDTAIFFFSDHGEHLGGPFLSFQSKDIQYEITLPFFFTSSK